MRFNFRKNFSDGVANAGLVLCFLIYGLAGFEYSYHCCLSGVIGFLG